MATLNPATNLSGLARRLVLDGLLSEIDARQASEQALKKRTPFVTHLVDTKLLGSRAIAWAAAQEFGVPLFDLKAMDMEALPVKLVDEKLIRQHHALPLFKRGNRLFVGMSDPTNLQALDEIKFHTGVTTEVVLVEEDKLSKAIEHALDVLPDRIAPRFDHHAAADRGVLREVRSTDDLLVPLGVVLGASRLNRGARGFLIHGAGPS
jgi:type IV pilus assembly protein PilB